MNNYQKWTISLIAGLLFALISLPFTYGLTNKLLTPLGVEVLSYSVSNVTSVGLVLHSIVFTLLFRLVLAFYSKKDY